MTPEARSLLQALHQSDELDIRELGRLIPRRAGDHRDFYTLARLLEGGHIGHSAQPVGGSLVRHQLDVQATILYMSANGLTSYRGFTRSSPSDFVDPYFLTAAGMLALEEYKSQKIDRRWSIGIAVGAAVISAVLTALASQAFS